MNYLYHRQHGKPVQQRFLADGGSLSAARHHGGDQYARQFRQSNEGQRPKLGRRRAGRQNLWRGRHVAASLGHHGQRQENPGSCSTTKSSASVRSTHLWRYQRRGYHRGKPPARQSHYANLRYQRHQASPPAVGWSSNTCPSLTASLRCALEWYRRVLFPGGQFQSDRVRSRPTPAPGHKSIQATIPPARTDDYFRLLYHHGTYPTNASYSYVIHAECHHAHRLYSNYANAPDILILSNTPQVQAVKKASLGVVAANFWTNGNNSADLISVNNKSSVIT